MPTAGLEVPNTLALWSATDPSTEEGLASAVWRCFSCFIFFIGLTVLFEISFLYVHSLFLNRGNQYFCDWDVHDLHKEGQQAHGHCPDGREQQGCTKGCGIREGGEVCVYEV